MSHAERAPFGRLLGLTALLATLLIVSAGLTGCAASAPPDRDADIVGTVGPVTTGSGDVVASFLVSGTSAYDKASVTQTNDTLVFERTGDTYAEAERGVREGDSVEVWFTGPVAESYPVQATAEVIVFTR